MKLTFAFIAAVAWGVGCAEQPDDPPPADPAAPGDGGAGGGAPLSIGCVDDDACNPKEDDCVCPDCVADAFCSGSCVPDGYCDAYLEPCSCVDCGIHPVCRGERQP